MDLFDPDNRRTDLGGEMSSSLHQLAQMGRAEGLIRALRSSAENGISSDAHEIEQRRSIFDSNEKRLPRLKTLWKLICEALDDTILRILILAAFVNLVIGIVTEGWEEGWIDGAAILVAVVIIVAVTAGNDYVKQKQFLKLLSLREDQSITTIRDGQAEYISIFELVVGDVIELREGDSVPCDTVIIDAVGITANESNLTGEPDDLVKSALTANNAGLDTDPFLLAKSKVMSGKGRGLICCVGKNTLQGQAEEKLEMEDEDTTPLQAKLEKIATFIGKIGVYCALLTFTACMLNMVITKAVNGDAIFTESSLNLFFDYLILGITIIVVAVPEGLPLAVTIALAYSVMKMKEQNNLVRRLDASETMGGANEVCTDKTGTLTENRMTLVAFHC